MKRILVFSFAMTLLAGPVLAGPIKDSIPKAIEKTEPGPKGFTGIKDPGRLNVRPVLDWQFGVSQVALWGSTWWDIDSTQRFTKLGYPEMNKRARPMVERDDWAGVWRYQTKWNVGIGIVSGGLKYAFRRNRRWYIRELWVIMPTMVTVGHTYASLSNEKLIRTGKPLPSPWPLP